MACRSLVARKAELQNAGCSNKITVECRQLHARLANSPFMRIADWYGHHADIQYVAYLYCVFRRYSGKKTADGFRPGSTTSADIHHRLPSRPDPLRNL